MSHSLEEWSTAQRRAEGLFIDHFWPTWQQEGDEDKERNYRGQGRTKKKTEHPTRAKSFLQFFLKFYFLILVSQSLKVSLKSFSTCGVEVGEKINTV